ncbi:MAG: enoyl-CoA hydratase family protein [Dermatophilaceae bacterium]
MTDLVHLNLDGGVATITLDSPHNRNALSARLVEQLLDALRRADEDPAVRVAVLTHTGKTFCAGADLSEASQGAEGDPVRARGEQLSTVLRTMITLGTPVLGLVDGHVRAGGMGLIGACDLVVAGPSATFALTESRLGLAASVISVVVLPRLTGRDASRLFLTGETIDAETAARLGLVTEAADDPRAAADRLAASLLAASPQGLRESKQLVNHALVAAFDADRERVIDQSARLFASEEAREGMRAFLEKRPPRWQV